MEAIANQRGYTLTYIYICEVRIVLSIMNNFVAVIIDNIKQSNNNMQTILVHGS